MGTFIISDFTSTDTSAPIVREDYAADNFNRVGPALGSTVVGGYPWQQSAGATHTIAGHRLQMSVIPASSHAMAFFEEAHVNGVLSATLVAVVGNPNRGLILGYNKGTGTAYVLVSDGINYSIRARAASGGLTTLATSTGVTPVVGDRLEFEVNGADFKARVNGVQIISVSNTVYAPGIGKGVWAFQNGGTTAARVEWDDLSWSAL